jgi:quercetin dioxygenase-like cupin family protein
MSQDKRRIVTGTDEKGRSVIVEQGPTPNVVTPVPGMELAEQWGCERVVEALHDAPAAGPDGFSLVPPPGGVLFRVVTFPPDAEGQMHRTETVDLVTVLAGELALALDGGEEVRLGPGDTVIQRATSHAWRNYSDTPAEASVVLLGVAG